MGSFSTSGRDGRQAVARRDAPPHAGRAGVVSSHGLATGGAPAPGTTVSSPTCRVALTSGVARRWGSDVGGPGVAADLRRASPKLEVPIVQPPTPQELARMPAGKQAARGDTV